MHATGVFNRSAWVMCANHAITKRYAAHYRYACDLNTIGIVATWFSIHNIFVYVDTVSPSRQRVCAPRAKYV